MAAHLEVSVFFIDLSEAFRQTVVNYFADAYQHGETPNPCLVCNPRIKFGRLLEEARSRGAESLATGHYARIGADRDGRQLLRGIDPQKDQSYFLARLTPDQLAAARFPLGGLRKTDVRALAAERGLTPAATGESQDICFIRGMDYAEFLARRMNLAAAPGPIVDTAGRTIGRHPGLHRFTVGQRRGIDCPAAAPYYVIRIDAAANRLVVGTKAELSSAGCRIREMNWIARPPTAPISVMAKLRYRSPAAAVRLIPTPGNGATLVFDTPQQAVTPGQGAVFYDGDRVLGGGWIDSGQASPENPRTDAIGEPGRKDP
jgi:tRNA-uridine 2-sulfurtransferase